MSEQAKPAASAFFDRMSKGTAESKPAAPVIDSKARLEEMRKLAGKPTVITTTTTPPHEPLKTDVVTTAPVTTQTTTAEPPRKPRKVAKGYENLDAAAKRQAEAADRLADAATKLADASTAKTAEPAAPQLTEEQQRNLDILATLEQLYPDRYKDASKKAQSLIPKIAAWKESHPDATNEEIEAAVGEMEEKAGIPEVTEREFARAEFEIDNRPERERLAKLEQEQKRLLEKEREREVIKPAVEQNSRAAVIEVAAEFGDEFKSLVGSDGNVAEDAAAKFIDTAKDPVVAEIGVNAIQSVKSFAEAVVLAFNGKPTPQVSAYCKGLEAQFSQEPPESLTDKDGRQWLPRSEYMKLPKDKRQDFWILGEKEVIKLATADIVKMAKEDIEVQREKVKKYAERYGLKPVETKQTTEPAPVAKPTSPTVGNPNPTQTQQTNQPAASNFFERMKTGVRASGLEGRLPKRPI